MTHISLHDLGLMDLPVRQQKNDWHVARKIAEAGRYSAFDATATKHLEQTMQRIRDKGWFEEDAESCAYPWILVKLTDKGRMALGMV